jgi:hypothetical protein
MSDAALLQQETGEPVPTPSSRLAGWVQIAAPAIMVVIAIGSLLPLGVWWADASADGYRGAWQTWAWGTLVVLLISALLLILSRGRASSGMLESGKRVNAIPAGLFLGGLAALLAVATGLVSLVVFSGNPRSVDGFAHLFQARIFLSGHFWAPAPHPAANFSTLHMIVGPERWYSQYPPGDSALLAMGLELGAWWILNPLIAACLAIETYRVARWCAGEGTARISAVLCLLSPFLVATSASEMNHLPAAALGMMAAACSTMLAGSRPSLAAAGVGVCLGLMSAFRPLDAVAAALPILVITLLTTPRPFGVLGIVAVTGAIASIPTLAYNAATTGHWLTFGYSILWGPDLRLGFHPVPWGVPLTPLRAVGLTAQDLHQLNTYALDLPFPMLAVIGFGFTAGRRSLTVRDAVPVIAILALSGIMFFYWHRDVFYGPRFLFSVLPWYLILMARSLVIVSDAGRVGRTVALAVVVALVVGSITITPSRFRAYQSGTAAFDLHPDRDARAAGISNAVVVIPDGWGTRLIARMWEAGIPVRNSTRVYTAIDACNLELALDDATRDPGRGARIGATLDSLVKLHRPGVPVRVTEDPNLRLIPNESLPDRCRAEIEFDNRYGVLAYAPYLYLNTATIDGDVVWARDLGPANAALFERYQGRHFYRYIWSGSPARPVFLPIESPRS